MEGKFELQLEESEYYLVRTDTNDVVATTDKVLLKEYPGYMQKLSLKNCQAIVNGYDLDELISVELKKLPYEKHVDDGQYNDGQLAGFELGAEWGFQKALEILGDKKFSEFDIVKTFEYGWNQRHFGKTDEDELREIQKRFIQSLQQTEWDVFFNPDEKDSEGCLILKRL